MTARRDGLLHSSELPAAVQRHVATHAEYRRTLAINPRLDEEAWLTCYPPGVDMVIAESLVSRPLSASHIDYVLAHEPRVQILNRLVRTNTLTHEQLTRLPMTISDQVVQLLLTADRFDFLDFTARRAIAEKYGGMPQLEFLATHWKQLGLNTAREWLTRFQHWGPGGRQVTQSALLTSLFSQAPPLLDVVHARAVDPGISMVAGGCRHLQDPSMQRATAGLVYTASGWQFDTRLNLQRHIYTIKALTANPVVSRDIVCDIAHAVIALDDSQVNEACIPEIDRRLHDPRPHVTGPFHAVSDPRQLEWLVQRTCPAPKRPRGRPADFEELIANPHLDAQAVTALIRAHGGLYLQGTPEVMAQRRHTLEVALMRCGAGGYPLPAAASGPTEPPPRWIPFSVDVDPLEVSAFLGRRARTTKHLAGMSWRSIALLGANGSRQYVAAGAVVRLLSQTLTSSDGEPNLAAWDIALALIDELPGELDVVEAAALFISLAC